MDATLTFLGTGTSMGVPTLGCACAVCTSADPHDKRLRPALLLRWRHEGRDRVVIIDTGPDFRQQALGAGLTRVDAVLYTHGHADHILGLDDLRPLSYTMSKEGTPIRLLASPETREVLERIYDYTFAPGATYTHRARVRLEPLEDRFELFGASFVRVPLVHGTLKNSGFRFGRTAYLTDVSEIPESSFDLLEDLDCLILSALRHTPHPNHATLAQAIEWAQRIGARQIWFTHIAHELGHEQTNRTLPAGMALAYDQLSFQVAL
jgi:phosphoribosyl 1,2-cyclic phosphate phosphodiesterase